MKRFAVAAVVCVLSWPVMIAGQRGAGGAPPVSPRQGAPIDLTGYWVSVVIEDWEYRMVTPSKGVFDAVPLNAEGLKIAKTWDPARDEAAGEQCRAYGAAAIMRVPGRLHTTWQDDNTLKIETDAGTQTRLFRFGAAASAAASAPGEPTWQGHSVAQWINAGGGRGAPTRGSLKVVTTNLRPGYIRKNGPPYSSRATITEYFDLHAMPNGDQWLSLTSKVEDPGYFTRPYITSTDFKKLPNAAGWNPTPCSVK
jgi:hypothetical protein